MPDADPSSRIAFLEKLADSLGQAIADNGGVLVHVSPSPDGFNVGVAPLEGQPPADVLLGSVAPEEWTALGVASRARSRPLDAVQPSSSGTPVDVVVLVDRTGHVVSRVRQGERTFTEPPAWGLTLDCLQRALELPTAPPLVPSGELFAVTWLERVIAAGRLSPRLSWAAIRALHPALELLADDDDGPALVDLVRAAETLGRTCDWDRLRWLVVEESWHDPCITPSDAAWFDAGGFSRWILGHHAPLAQLLADASKLIGAADARRCERVLARLGLRSAA